MMRKFIFILIFGLMFCVPSAHAVTVDLISVAFEHTPLFGESNLAPGTEVTRYVRVTNVSSAPTPISFDAINETGTGLGEYIHLSVRQNSVVLYDDTLAHLFVNGASALTDIPVGQTVQYDFTATFDSDAGDEAQSKTVTFDLIIAARGADGETFASDNPGGSVTGGGTYYPTPTPSVSPMPTSTPTSTPTLSTSPEASGSIATPTPTSSGQSGDGSNIFAGLEGTGGQGPSPSPSSLAGGGSSNINNLLANIGGFFGNIDWPWWLLLLLIPVAYWCWRRRRK